MTKGPTVKKKKPRYPRVRSSTPLAKWMDKPGAPKARAIADGLGVALVTVYNYRRGIYKPSRDVAVRLAAFSAGAVPVEAWS